MEEVVSELVIESVVISDVVEGMLLVEMPSEVTIVIAASEVVVISVNVLVRSDVEEEGSNQYNNSFKNNKQYLLMWS